VALCADELDRRVRAAVGGGRAAGTRAWGPGGVGGSRCARRIWSARDDFAATEPVQPVRTPGVLRVRAVASEGRGRRRL